MIFGQDQSHGTTPACQRFVENAFIGNALDSQQQSELFKPKGTIAPKILAQWTEDALLQAMIDLHRSKLVCTPPLSSTLLADLEALYLKRLNFPKSQKLSSKDRQMWARLLAVPATERNALKDKLRQTSEPTPNSIFGFALNFHGVWLLASAPLNPKILDERLSKVCDSFPCDFWNPNLLFKVVIIPSEGVAAYRAETATLVLSRSLTAENRLLEQFIFFHELAHLRIQKAKVMDQNWNQTFAKFSGWLEPEIPLHLHFEMERLPRKPDNLQQESEGTPFSILPDRVIKSVKVNGESYEGFVLEKTYRRVIESGDVEEDLADHIAAFIVAPSRFCSDNQPIAAKKHKWIAANILSDRPPLNCSTP